MDHVAIMSVIRSASGGNKKLGLIGRILSGHKTIETRWYKNKSSPWDKIEAGETIYFKDSGGPIRASAIVVKVKQFSNLTLSDSQKIVDKYGSVGLIDIQDKNVTTWAVGKNYAILIWLKNIKSIAPFQINKSGFGSACAWITTNDIDTIRVS